MGIETLIMLGAGALAGGTVSKATGGSFVKGAALGAATGGVGVAVDRATGGNVTGGPNVERDKKLGIYGKESPGSLAARQAAAGSASSEEARRLLISGNPQRLVKSSGLTGSTSSGSSARRRLLGA